MGEQADRRLLAALRGDHYLHEEENGIWREVTDERTDAYVTRRDRYEAPHNVFIPTATEGRERYDELYTPLGELAEQRSQERTAKLETGGAPTQRAEPEPSGSRSRSGYRRRIRPRRRRRRRERPAQRHERAWAIRTDSRKRYPVDGIKTNAPRAQG